VTELGRLVWAYIVIMMIGYSYFCEDKFCTIKLRFTRMSLYEESILLHFSTEMGPCKAESKKFKFLSSRSVALDDSTRRGGWAALLFYFSGSTFVGITLSR